MAMEWEEILAREGYRITAARRALIAVLTGTRVPLSPQEIFDQAQVIHSHLGLVTVYRMLDVLESLGLVQRIHCEDECHAYLPASPGHRHMIVCRGCGQAAEFPGNEDLEAISQLVQQATGYQVEEHWLQLVGLCRNCQGK